MTLDKESGEQSTNDDYLNSKIAEFHLAMERYNGHRIYTCLERINSVLIMGLQALVLFDLASNYQATSPILILIAFIASYFITDFVNGFIHMYMDNNTHYTSLAGPFIASFHLHHARPQYTLDHPLKAYFYESGTKFWLLVFLFILGMAQYYLVIPYALNVCLVSIGILSSVAEVSHYWCHNASSKNKVILLLQKYGLLLSKRHHIVHHKDDNTHYAFLNGMSDPVLNAISRCYYSGYKTNADAHTAAYLKNTQTKP